VTALLVTVMLALAGMLVAQGGVTVLGNGVQRWQLGRRARALTAPAITSRGPVRKNAAGALLRNAGGRFDTWLLYHVPLARWYERELAVAPGPLTITHLAGGYGAFMSATIVFAFASLAGDKAIGCIAIAAIAGTILAAMVVRRRARRYRAAFVRAFPDAVAMLVRGLRAGMPVAAVIIELSREATEPAAGIFREITESMRLGQSLEAALWAAARRLALPDFDFLVVTIALQLETGGNIAETLGRLDDTLRMRRQLTLKVKAMSAEARASAGIIGAMPIVMAGLMLIVSPDYLTKLFTTDLGHMMVAGGLGSLAIGAFIIEQMMRIEA